MIPDVNLMSWRVFLSVLSRSFFGTRNELELGRCGGNFSRSVLENQFRANAEEIVMFTAQRAVMRASDGRQIFNGQKTTEKPLLIARKLSTSLLFSVYVPVLAVMVVAR